MERALIQSNETGLGLKESRTLNNLNDYLDAATRFVDVVKRHEKSSEFSDNDLNTVKEVLIMKGFSEFQLIKVPTGKYNPDMVWGKINTYFPYSVIFGENEHSLRMYATGWLNWIYEYVLRRLKGVDHQKLAELVRRQIEANQTVSIRLSMYGDMLYLIPSACGLFLNFSDENYTWESLLPTINSHNPEIGTHVYCEGKFQRHHATAKHDVLVCSRCHLRVYFSTTVHTYADLRTDLGADCHWQE